MMDFDKLKISEVPVDYDSPINMIVQRVAQGMFDRMAKLDNEVGDLLVGTAIKLGFDVDREKLIAVLTQDRERYVHAYRQGYEKRDDDIVRCKDCKHSEPWYGDKSRCFLWHETGIDVFNDGFCNYGERQEGR